MRNEAMIPQKYLHDIGGDLMVLVDAEEKGFTDKVLAVANNFMDEPKAKKFVQAVRNLPRIEDFYVPCAYADAGAYPGREMRFSEYDINFGYRDWNKQIGTTAKIIKATRRADKQAAWATLYEHYALIVWFFNRMVEGGVQPNDAFKTLVINSMNYEKYATYYNKEEDDEEVEYLSDGNICGTYWHCTGVLLVKDDLSETKFSYVGLMSLLDNPDEPYAFADVFPMTSDKLMYNGKKLSVEELVDLCYPLVVFR